MMFGLVSQAVRLGSQNVKRSQVSQIRHAGTWYYRRFTDPPSRFKQVVAEGIMAMAWWWVLWHLWKEPEHITGHYPMPDASKWTDAELGIPPDDED